jgi:CRP/FNR family transcriptional regulator
MTTYTLPSALSELGELVTFPEGTIIVRPKLAVDYVYEIVSGLVKAYTLGDHEQQSIHIVFGPGDMFPMSWLIGKPQLNIYIRASSNVQARRYPKITFMELAKTDLVVASFAISKLVDTLKLCNVRIDILEYRLAPQRLACQLIHLANRFGAEGPDGEIALPIFSNLDLGGMVNLSREYVNRELGRFSKLGLIRVVDKQIYIVHPEGLQAEISIVPAFAQSSSVV